MRTLVTGGAGFIGSNLVDRLLADGHSVVVLDNLATGKRSNLDEAHQLYGDRLTFREIDVCDPRTKLLIEESGVDVVFHLAAQLDVRVSIKDPVFDAEVNVLGALHVLEGCRDGGIKKICFASSGGTIYGEDESRLPFDELCPQEPVSPYGVAKAAFGMYLSMYKRLHGLDYVALALANVYGPRQDPFGEGGVVSIFSQRLSAGLQCTIYGDGSSTRDFVHVADVVDAFARSMTIGSGLYNIASGGETTTLRLYETIAANVGVNSPPKFVPMRPGEVQRSVLDADRARRELGWSPQVSLASGVQTVLAYVGQTIDESLGSSHRG